jgi:hypothetical protein
VTYSVQNWSQDTENLNDTTMFPIVKGSSRLTAIRKSLQSTREH